MRVGLFESYPWALILLVIVIVEAWSALKTLIWHHLHAFWLSRRPAQSTTSPDK
jgi:hypothetical protein